MSQQSMAKFVVYGFVRIIDREITIENNYGIIPDSLYSLCLSLYNSFDINIDKEFNEKYCFDAATCRVISVAHKVDKSNETIDKTDFFKTLIQNASDALDKSRYNQLAVKETRTNNLELKIQIIADNQSNTLTIRDTGIGMTLDDLTNGLSKCSHAGPRDISNITEYLERLEKIHPDSPIQCYIGMYSIFLVADKVMVRTKHDDDCQYLWQYDARNDIINDTDERMYSIESENNSLYKLERGTEIILWLKPEYCELSKRDTIKALFVNQEVGEFIAFPIYLKQDHK